MNTIAQTSGVVNRRVQKPWKPVGEVTIQSPFMDPEEALGPFGRDLVESFRLAYNATVPAFSGRNCGDLHDWCEAYRLKLIDPKDVGRLHGTGRFMGLFRFLIVEDN